MSEGSSGAGSGVPGAYRSFIENVPAPADGTTRRPIEIGMGLGAGLESATRSEVRRAHAAEPPRKRWSRPSCSA